MPGHNLSNRVSCSFSKGISQKFPIGLYILILCHLACSIVNGSSSQSEVTVNKQTSPKTIKRTRDRYCGLYCLYTVMQSSKMNVDFESLLKKEYVGSWEGSSLRELKKAAEDHGLHAELFGKLTRRDLCQSPYPILLHVKFDKDTGGYNHFVLFLGTINGKAKVFDPPHPIALIPFHELTPQWDGNGLILSTNPIKSGVIFSQTWKVFIICTTVIIGFILIVRIIRHYLSPLVPIASRRKLLLLSIVQATGVLFLGVLIGILYHFVNDAGFLAHAGATASVEKVNRDKFISKVSKKKVEYLLDTKTVFVDARFVRDFKKGHLEGSISIPVNSEDSYRKEAMDGIAKDARIVVYCQSSGCKFANEISIKLLEDGFSNISLFRGGWREWDEQTN